LSLNEIKYFRTTKCNKAQKMVEVKYSVSQVKEKSAIGMYGTKQKENLIYFVDIQVLPQ
jgi:hypothetical protein